MPHLPPKNITLPAGAAYAITEYFGKDSVPSSERVSVAIETIERGVKKPRHLHRRTEEIYFVLSGQGTVNADGVDHALSAGNAFYIPIDQPHFLMADSAAPLSVLLISFPSFDESDYILC